METAREKAAKVREVNKGQIFSQHYCHFLWPSAFLFDECSYFLFFVLNKSQCVNMCYGLTLACNSALPCSPQVGVGGELER